mmetsp:Transcript_37925/g.101031  ORF Transcript_37925/g.101031 Transcript_37925/m.101031 type:complete len:232 (+) Transcript_37925:371-1066(+)
MPVETWKYTSYVVFGINVTGVHCSWYVHSSSPSFCITILIASIVSLMSNMITPDGAGEMLFKGAARMFRTASSGVSSLKDVFSAISLNRLPAAEGLPSVKSLAAAYRLFNLRGNLKAPMALAIGFMATDPPSTPFAIFVALTKNPFTSITCLRAPSFEAKASRSTSGNSSCSCVITWLFPFSASFKSSSTSALPPFLHAQLFAASQHFRCMAFSWAMRWKTVCSWLTARDR